MLLWRFTLGPILGPSRGRILGPSSSRLRAPRPDALLLYALLNCHARRPTRSALLPFLATTHEPGDKESDKESDECPHSSSKDIPPASSPHVLLEQLRASS